MERIAEFSHLITSGSTEMDRLALTIAAHANPSLDIAATLDRIDDLAEEVRGGTMSTLMADLFGSGRFRGNVADYRDPENSYLDRVLDRGLGIPISLGVLAAAVGRRTGVGILLMDMPGHVIVREVDSGDLWDPFGGGRLLDSADFYALLRRAGPGQRRITQATVPTMGPRRVVERMLGNLLDIFSARHDAGSLEWVLSLLVLVRPELATTRRALCDLLLRDGDLFRAAARLELLASLGDTPDAALATEAVRLRARLN